MPDIRVSDSMETFLTAIVHKLACTSVQVINPRRACPARVTFVILSVCLSVCLSVTTFSAATSNKTANKRYEWVQCHTGFIFKMAFFVKILRSYGVKQSEEANPSTSSAYLGGTRRCNAGQALTPACYLVV